MTHPTREEAARNFVLENLGPSQGKPVVFTCSEAQRVIAGSFLAGAEYGYKEGRSEEFEDNQARWKQIGAEFEAKRIIVAVRHEGTSALEQGDMRKASEFYNVADWLESQLSKVDKNRGD